MRRIIMRFVFFVTGTNQQDEGKPVFDGEDIDISDLIPVAEVAEPEIVEKKLVKREKLDKKRKIEQILDETLPLDVPSIVYNS